MSGKKETRLLMISPASTVTPDLLSRTIHSMGRPVTVKETCYGCLIEGPPEELREIRDEARKMDPHGIYSKVRAYPAGDPRRCRAQHGTRPGYAQLEWEWKALAHMRYALDCEAAGEAPPAEKTRKRIPPREFKDICEEIE
ncbi:MAG: methanogenesis marker protein 6 [Thermoplasmatales archaeon]|nr:methanogenesis marker protein 6 [Thermoplasmatales archaeon]